MAVNPRAIVLYDANDVPISVTDGSAIPAGTDGLLATGKDKNASARILVTSQQGLPYISPIEIAAGDGTISTGLVGFAAGKRATSATGYVQIITSGNTQPAANGQRSVKSSSANDTSAGSGVRTLRLTYYSISGSTVTGPFTEDISMNGTTAVNTSSSTIAFVERMDALTIGSLPSASTITVFTNTGGTGAAINTMTATEYRSSDALHYVPSGLNCYIKDLLITSSVANTGFPAFDVRWKDLGTANAAYRILYKEVRAQGSVNSLFLDFDVPAKVPGPAEISFWVNPPTTAAQTAYVESTFIEVPS